MFDCLGVIRKGFLYDQENVIRVLLDVLVRTLLVKVNVAHTGSTLVPPPNYHFGLTERTGDTLMHGLARFRDHDSLQGVESEDENRRHKDKGRGVLWVH